MKKLGLFTIGFILFSWQLFAQDIKKEKDPDEQIIVNKKYDENGNLIQFDSTYVHQWSSDSTFQFSFPDGSFSTGNGFPDLNDFFKNFEGDSAIGNFNFPDAFGQMPFDDEEFFKKFHHHFPDSMMMGIAPPDTDSLAQHYYFSNPGSVPQGFSYPDMEEFEKRLNEQLKKYPFPDFQMPQFNNDEQRKEWQELMKKHQKEIQELKKKWENEN